MSDNLDQKNWENIKDMLCNDDFDNVKNAMVLLESLLLEDTLLVLKDGSSATVLDCFGELGVTTNYWADVSCPDWMKKARHRYYITIYLLGLRAKNGDPKPLEIDKIVCSQEPFWKSPIASNTSRA